MTIKPLRILAALATALLAACGPAENVGSPTVELVRADGTYPTRPLEKDTVVVKVIQNGVTNLQEAESLEAGLAANLARMISFGQSNAVE